MTIIFITTKKVYNHKSKSKTDFQDLVSNNFFGQIQTKGVKIIPVI